MKNKKIDLILANFLFILHFFIVGILLFGWAFPRIYYIYVILLIITLIYWLFLGYCPITKWEFNIRRKYEPGLNYKNEYIEYYASKLFKINIPVFFIRIIGVIFLVISLLIAI
jgi:hypothetical protein